MLRYIRDLFVRNWGLKLSSFILALIIWFTMIPEEKTFSEKTLTVPLEIHNIPADMEMMEKPQATVDVQVRAPNRMINEITAMTVQAVLDLRNASVTQTEYPLNRNMISIPFGTELKQWTPSVVHLRMEKTEAVMLDVEPNITGELADGLKLIRVEIDPPQVLIRGPESQINSSYKVKTTPIDVSDFTESLEFKAQLILPNPALKLASSQATVTVRMLIQSESSEEAPPGKRPARKP